MPRPQLFDGTLLIWQTTVPGYCGGDETDATLLRTAMALAASLAHVEVAFEP
jgi:hypothetical protein